MHSKYFKSKINNIYARNREKHKKMIAQLAAFCRANEHKRILFKSDKHPIYGGHYAILTAEKPKFPCNYQSMNEHDEFKTPYHHLEDQIKKAGYKYEKVKGFYDEPENSFLIHNPDINHVVKLGKAFGQESILHSKGGHNELIHTNGDLEDRKFIGKGLIVHDTPPKDLFSTIQTPNGPVHFTAHLDFEKHYPHEDVPAPITKKHEYFRHLAKNLKKAINLIHYSNQSDLEHIDPTKHGTGADTRRYQAQALPETPRSYYYIEGAGKPESIVSSPAKQKYTVENFDENKLYDLGEDKDGIVPHVKSKNPKASSEDFVREVKDRGFHGFRNTKSSLPHAVGIFYPLKPTKKHW